MINQENLAFNATNPPTDCQLDSRTIRTFKTYAVNVILYHWKERNFLSQKKKKGK